MEFSELSIDELIDLYARIPAELRTRGVIRSGNFLGDLGEYIAIQHYNNTPGLPNLQSAPAGTQNIDAISRNGERYSIKTTRSNRTGVFYGLNDPESQEIDKQKFEFVIVVQSFDDYKVRKIIELTWEQFLEYKRWDSRMRAWHLSMTKQMIAEANVLVDNEEVEQDASPDG